MRFTRILSLAAVAVFASATATSAAPSAPDATLNAIMAPASLVISAVQDPPAQPQTQVKVDLDTDRDVVWYTDPVWLAVGAIALLVVIVLAVMAARGGDRGGTTVVR